MSNGACKRVPKKESPSPVLVTETGFVLFGGESLRRQPAALSGEVCQRQTSFCRPFMTGEYLRGAARGQLEAPSARGARSHAGGDQRSGVPAAHHRPPQTMDQNVVLEAAETAGGRFGEAERVRLVDRGQEIEVIGGAPGLGRQHRVRRVHQQVAVAHRGRGERALPARLPVAAAAVAIPRSEEHTSELQSRENLVCRLL